VVFKSIGKTKKPALLLVGMASLSVYCLLRLSGDVSLLEGIKLWILFGVVIKASEENFKSLMYKDKLTFSVMGIGVLLNFIIAIYAAQKNGNYSLLYSSVINSFFGIAVGIVCMVLLNLVGTLLFKKECIGGGDVKLVAGMGAFFGVSIFRIVPIWLFIWLAYAAVQIIVNSTQKENKVNIIPSGPMHFMSLMIFLLLIKSSVDNISIGLLAIFFVLSVFVLLKPRANEG